MDSQPAVGMRHRNCEEGSLAFSPNESQGHWVMSFRSLGGTDEAAISVLKMEECEWKTLGFL